MKTSEMNARQKKAFFNIKYAACNLIGGLENIILDNQEGSKEYEYAKNALENHNGLVTEIYDMAITDIYQEGCVLFGEAAERHMKDVRFCGKAWLLEQTEARVRKMEY